MRFPRFALAFAALGLVAPQIAAAHTQLVSSSPAANTTVARPTKIELRFNEPVIGATARATIVMTGMPGMANHAPMAITGFTAKMGKDRTSMTLLLRRPLTAGTYQVSWTAAGMDTHRMSGTFTFTVR